VQRLSFPHQPARLDPHDPPLFRRRRERPGHPAGGPGLAHPQQPYGDPPAATLSAALFFAQAYIGALKTSQGFPVFLLAMHVATAAAVWAALVITAEQTGLSPHIAEEEQKTLETHVSTWQRIRDLLSMTRPVVTCCCW